MFDFKSTSSKIIRKIPVFIYISFFFDLIKKSSNRFLYRTKNCIYFRKTFKMYIAVFSVFAFDREIVSFALARIRGLINVYFSNEITSCSNHSNYFCKSHDQSSQINFLLPRNKSDPVVVWIIISSLTFATCNTM